MLHHFVLKKHDMTELLKVLLLHRGVSQSLEEKWQKVLKIYMFIYSFVQWKSKWFHAIRKRNHIDLKPTLLVMYC